MNKYLKITADIENDGTVGLTGVVSANRFTGTGEAWFNLSEVNEFIAQLENFSKTKEYPPEIAGGNWDGDGILKDRLFSLRFYLLSSIRAGVLIELADYPYTDCRAEEIASVSLELQPETQELISFCGQLKKLLNNGVSEACLVC
ncbi:MAG: hypothetical protein KUG78_18255 [Kangiellaceae bacterium]|nr:hypothetical protein [Kangiellaceae bacterium]